MLSFYKISAVEPSGIKIPLIFYKAGAKGKSTGI
ncbi:hypothetical protein H4V97_000718 [Flavobacterium sp. CG_23.5]|nr:hypothetical protein [Flavobacterium sp. CG_23.5]